MSTTLTPAQAWQSLLDGNARFSRGEMQHPSQGVTDRSALSARQDPFAVVFGCSDSRVAAEIVFDQGLGDLFVVRTAGHVLDTAVLGSIEYGVAELGASLVLVLGHRSCGAIRAAAAALQDGTAPTGFVRAIVDRVIPSAVTPAGDDHTAPALTLRPEELGREHVHHTVRVLQEDSPVLHAAVEDGRCAIVGAEYSLRAGTVQVISTVGPVGSAGA